MTRPSKDKAIAGPNYIEPGTNRRYERILLGTNARNARLAKFSRPIEPLDL